MQTILKGRILLDTNILIYAYDRSSPYHVKAAEIVKLALTGEFEAVVAQQNLIEFANVLTSNYKIPASSVSQDIENILKDFQLITPLPKTIHLFLKLIQDLNVKTYLFDIYLVATMIDNDIESLITLNDQDFAEIKGLTVINPYKKG